MKITFAGWLSLCMVLGCAAPEPLASADEAVFKGVMDFVARSADGDVVVASGASGAVRASAHVEGRIEDIAWDPWNARALVVVGEPEDEGGEIVCYAVGTGGTTRLGRREHLAWLDGRARLLASPFGAISFEESYGERWKLLGAAPTPSVIAPPPSSAWLTVSASGATVRAFAGGARREAEVSDAGIAAPSSQPIAGATGARLVRAPALGGEVLVSLSGDALALRVLRGDAVSAPSVVPLDGQATGVEAVVALDAGRIVVALLSGIDAVGAFALDDEGSVESFTSLPLASEVVESGGLLSRDLAVLGAGRVLVATRDGVLAASVTRGAMGVQIAVSPSFEGASLRGPLAVISSSP
jgi:hypothetical protein